ncbi:MAG: bromoperoxidase, partial [Verrucomicrobiota bacterium]
MKPRRQQAIEVRNAAAQAAYDRNHPDHVNNSEEYRYSHEVDPHPEHPGVACAPTHLANFTKGLPHDSDGCVANHEDYELFVTSIQSGNPRDFRDVPLGPYQWASPKGKTPPKGHACVLKLDKHQNPVPCRPKGPVDKSYWLSDKAKNAEGGKGALVRAWESAGAGHQFELEGPDPQAVTMAQAPTLDSPELAAEMAEVYLMALLRDLPFTNFNSGGGADAITFKQALDYLGKFPANAARHPEGVKAENVLRGFTPGDLVGPYVSQYLLIGSNEQNQKGQTPQFGPEAGYVRYGSLRIDQRVRAASAIDYMRTWEQYIDVQNGADLRGFEAYEEDPRFRFISRPRDLATYVHYDALYEAYLNACLLLLDQGVPFDRGIPF